MQHDKTIGNPSSSGWSSLRRLLGVVRNHRVLLAFVSILLLIDLLWTLFFGVAATLNELDRDPKLYDLKLLLITKDRSIPEVFNYAKTLLLVILFIHMARSTRQPIYTSLAVLFSFVLLDDAMGLHESVGKYFVDLFEIPRRVLGLRDHDVGEVIAWSIVGVCFVPLIVFGLARSRPKHRDNGLAFLLAFGALLFCAVVVDQLYSNLHDVFFLSGVLVDMVEDGGEMMVISITCGLALAAVRESRQPLADPPAPARDDP